MLGTLPPKKTSSQRDMVPTLVHAPNYTRSTAVGFSPYYLMYGQKPQLLVDLYFGTQSTDMNSITSIKFVWQVNEKIRWAYKTAQQVIERENKGYKWNGNHNVKCTQLHVGDMVPLNRMTFKGKHGIQDHWEKTIYRVEGQPYAGLPVFRTAPVEGEGKLEVVYQNLLLPFGSNVEDSENEESWQNDDAEADTKAVSTAPECEGWGDAICVQCVKTMYKPSYWVNTMWE